MAVARPARKEALLSMVESRALLLVADRVHAMAADTDPRADAILLNGSRVARVGRASELRADTPHAQVLDLPGTTLTPGFTDAHIHLLDWALARTHADLAGARTPAEVATMAAAHAAVRPVEEWVRGVGWNPHRWGGAYPEAELLDRAVPDRPAVLHSHDMHAVWANGEALRRAGIDRETADPPNGRIVRDARGQPTGVLLEYAVELITRVSPAPALEDVLDAVADAQTVLHRLGITGVHSFPGIHVLEPEPLLVLQRLRAADRLRLRVLQHIRLDHLDEAIRLGLQSGFGDDMIRLGAVKMFLDGALGSRTAWMREPYENSGDRGVSVLDGETFERHVARAATAGIASAVHAIGDAAVALALDVLGRAPYADLAMPHRIEHVQCCPPERLADAGRHGVVCSVQPSHLMSDWRAADRHWGARARTTYAFHSLAAGGATLAFGSDAPVEPVDPRHTLYAAVTRQDLAGEPAGGWHPRERIDVAAALAGCTRGPAIAAGLGGRLGQLAPGALADIVAWDRDPLAIPAPELLAMRCTAAFVAGLLVWRDT